jgi:hypothetical protein
MKAHAIAWSSILNNSTLIMTTYFPFWRTNKLIANGWNSLEMQIKTLQWFEFILKVKEQFSKVPDSRIGSRLQPLSMRKFSCCELNYLWPELDRDDGSEPVCALGREVDGWLAFPSWDWGIGEISLVSWSIYDERAFDISLNWSSVGRSQ